MKDDKFLLNISADDKPGIVAKVANTIIAQGGNITESHQYRDPESNRFFMRTAFDRPAGTVEDLQVAFEDALKAFEGEVTVNPGTRKPRIIIMVSKFDHAMLHLLYQIRVGWIDAEVVAIVSNHQDSRHRAEIEGITFHHMPVTPDTKPQQEAQLRALIEETGTDLVILARYMQILSAEMTAFLSGRAINIHHSFLPAFKGANPYKRAHERGVKLIGATAHYVTSDLDEGPIIEQDVRRVSHALTANEFVAEGREVESRVLAYAVKMHLERRAMMNGNRTVVFGNR